MVFHFQSILEPIIVKILWNLARFAYPHPACGFSGGGGGGGGGGGKLHV